MIDVNKLRSHYADAEVASALFNGLPHYSERTKAVSNCKSPRRHCHAGVVYQPDA